jgi:hypothetical protein
MAPTEKIISSYVLAVAWEITVLLTTANVNYLNRRIPIIMAICSGVILLFFIHAFDPDLNGLEYFKRWFIGLLIATINIVFSGLFYSKWCEAKKQRSFADLFYELEISFRAIKNELLKTKSELTKAKADFDQLFTHAEELESFKAKELEKLKCPYCNGQYETIFKLTSHKGVCNLNPRKGMKQSLFDEVQTMRNQQQW